MGLLMGLQILTNSSLPRKQTHQNLSVANNGSYGRGPLQGGPSASNYGHNGLCSPIQWYDGPVYSNGHQRSTASSTSYGSNSSAAKNQDQRPTTNLMGMHVQIPSSGMGLTSPSYTTRMYLDSRFYGQYGPYENTQKVGLGYGSNVYNSRNNGRWGVVDTKYKPRGRAPFVFGSENQDGFTELNRGPRSGGFKHQKPLGPTVTIAVKGQALPTIGKQENSVLPDNGQFNQEGFPETFFIIKSYSEDDVHKSVKYNVWASTPNGNKKLDAGYREAQENLIECPVFLLFSVNTSDRFVGVAEMVGPVDFDKTVDYWQQDKWNGCFPVKWHIVKDVPNNILKHITLDNNDNYHCSWWKRQVAQSSHAAYNFAPLLTEWITTSGAVSPETALTASEEGDKMLRMGYQPGRPGFDRKKLLLYAIICGCRWQIDRLLKDLPTLFNTIEDFLWFKLSALWEYTSTSSSDVLNEGLLPYTLEDLQNYLNKFEPSYYTKSGKDPLVYPYVLFLSIQLLPIILYLSKEVGEEGYHVDAVHISIALADHGVLPDGVGSGQKMCVIDACAEAASIIWQYGSIHLCNGNLDLALEYYAQAAAALGGREVSWIGQGNADFIKGTFPGLYSQTIKSWFPEEHT